eukprot:TRINITY_DN19063_c0_g1_i1.p1 TRINITY_DN19063_c0_g1~~TRINITY_DN19063_c0_g1_i1.p1  ORF type:complete len:125 (-),score=5.48 TRINITY_DN19063_c0_g1_i1:183-533(-)
MSVVFLCAYSVAILCSLLSSVLGVCIAVHERVKVPLSRIDPMLRALSASTLLIAALIVSAGVSFGVTCGDSLHTFHTDGVLTSYGGPPGTPFYCTTIIGVFWIVLAVVAFAVNGPE